MDNMEFLKAMLAEMNAKMDVNTKAMKDEIKEDMNANRKADQENLQAMIKEINEMKDKIKEGTNANRKADREDLTEMMNANQAKMNINLKEMRDEIRSGQAEMKSAVCAIQSELEDINHKTQDLHKELTNKLEKTHVELQAETSERRNDDTPLGYSGEATLRREHCNRSNQHVARQQLCKRGPTRNNRGSCVFRVHGDVTQE
jgi:acetyl/propionyl-CoA carboxylase alpha subunit